MREIPRPLAKCGLALQVTGRVVVAAAFLGASGGCDWVQPFEKVCETRLAPTRVEVETAAIQSKVDLTHGIAELTAMGAATAGRVVLGLTQTNLKWTVSMGGNGITRRFGGAYCLRPAVKVRLAFEPMTVSIAQEYPQGSCRFNITMTHEQKHVRAYEKFLAGVGERVQKDLQTQLGEKILYFRTAEEADQRLQTITRDTLGPIVDGSMQEVTAIQAAVDSPEEYFRLDRFQEACE